MKKHSIRVLAVLFAVVFLISGCGLFSLGKPTAASLAGKAFDNVEKSQSAEVKVSTVGDITATYEVLNIGMNLDLKTDVDMEMTRDPKRRKGTVSMGIGAAGQEQTINGEFYTDTAEDGSDVTYVSWNQGEWIKKTGEPVEEADTEEAEENPIKIPDSLAKSVGLLKAMKDGSLAAELKEETVTVNDKEAYQISCMVGGELIKTMLLDEMTDKDDSTMDMEAIDWGNVSIPVELYIYKESELPARITMDVTSIASQLVEKMFKEAMTDLPLDDLRLDVNSYVVDITIDRYDEIEAIEIPADAAAAKEAESLTPSMTDLLQF